MSQNSSSTPPLVSFYSPTIAACDVRGRTLTQILSWNDDRLETCHDYIQILFPLPEGSMFNSAVPIIDKETYNAFHADSTLRDNLRRSFDRMLAFYGFRMTSTGDQILIQKHEDYRQCFKNWVTRFDHNHLRMTRILRSLRILGLEKEARAFYDALKAVYETTGRINGKSLMFWARAMERPLYLPPDEDDYSQGVRWLRTLEEANRKRKREEDEVAKTKSEKAGEGSTNARKSDAGQTINQPHIEETQQIEGEQSEISKASEPSAGQKAEDAQKAEASEDLVKDANSASPTVPETSAKESPIKE